MDGGNEKGPTKGDIASKREYIIRIYHHIACMMRQIWQQQVDVELKRRQCIDSEEGEEQ